MLLYLLEHLKSYFEKKIIIISKSTFCTKFWISDHCGVGARGGGVKQGSRTASAVKNYKPNIYKGDQLFLNFERGLLFICQSRCQINSLQLNLYSLQFLQNMFFFRKKIPKRVARISNFCPEKNYCLVLKNKNM